MTHERANNCQGPRYDCTLQGYRHICQLTSNPGVSPYLDIVCKKSKFAQVVEEDVTKWYRNCDLEKVIVHAFFLSLPSPLSLHHFLFLLFLNCLIALNFNLWFLFKTFLYSALWFRKCNCLMNIVYAFFLSLPSLHLFLLLLFLNCLIALNFNWNDTKLRQWKGTQNKTF